VAGIVGRKVLTAAGRGSWYHRSSCDHDLLGIGSAVRPERDDVGDDWGPDGEPSVRPFAELVYDTGCVDAGDIGGRTGCQLGSPPARKVMSVGLTAAA